MKIAVLIPSLQEAGPIIVAENIAKFSHIDIKYYFISLRANKDKDKYRFIQNNFEFYEIGMEKIPTYKTITKLKQYMSDINPDIIHAHCFWPTILAMWLKNYKKIVTLHNIPNEDFYFLYGRVISILMCMGIKLSLKYFNKCIAISESVKNAHKVFNLENKTFLIYNGIEDQNIINKTLSANKVFNIISTMGLIPRKNTITALKVINKLVKNNFCISYYILGDGKEKENLIKYVNENNLNKVVHFLGIRPREEVFAHLAMADCFLLPSFSEGHPLAVIEAMMMQKAVIASNIPSIAEIIQNDIEGYICDVLDVDSYYNAIVKVMDENNRCRLSQNARQAYLEKFTVEKMAAKYNELYCQMITER